MHLAAELERMLQGHMGVPSAIGGGALNVLGPAQHPVAFDFVLPDEPFLPVTPGARIVSHSAVDAVHRDLIEPEQVDLLGLLAKSGRRVVHVEAPPSIGDDPRLCAELIDMPFVPADSSGPSPAWLRYKLLRVHSAVVRRACAAAGVSFAAAPAAALVGGRFLRPDLYERPCHASVASDALVLRDFGVMA